MTRDALIQKLVARKLAPGGKNNAFCMPQPRALCIPKLRALCWNGLRQPAPKK